MRSITHIAGLSVLFLVSCGSPAVQVDDRPIAATELCEQLTVQLCTGNANCCDQVERQQELGTCIDDNAWLCDLVIGELATSTGFVYDAEAAGRLSAAIEASAATCDAVPDLGLDALFRWTRDAPVVGLARVLTPTLEEGEACGSEDAPAVACSVGTRCVFEDIDGFGGLAGRGEGRCEVEDDVQLSEGAFCRVGLGSIGGVEPECGDGLVCVPCWASSESGTCDESTPIGGGSCQADLALGESCGDGRFDGCGAETFCDAATRTCALPREDGVSCVSHRQCAAGECVFDGVPAVGPGTCGVTPPERTHCAVWRGLG